MRHAASLLFTLIVGAIPLSASADNAFTLRDAEVYTGPGTEYPPVAHLPPNTGVNVAGCLSDWSWCDVTFSDSRGWVYAADLGYPYQSNRVAIIEYGPRLGIPVVTFSLPAYWDAHYRSRPWYRERDVWVTRVHGQVEHGGRPPEGRAARTAQRPEATPAPQASQAMPAQPGQPQQPPMSQSSQPRQSQPPMQSQSQMPPSGQAAPAPSGRPPEGRPPENRPPENRPPSAESPARSAPMQRPDAGKAQEGSPPPEAKGAGDRDKQ